MKISFRFLPLLTLALAAPLPAQDTVAPISRHGQLPGGFNPAGALPIGSDGIGLSPLSPVSLSGSLPEISDAPVPDMLPSFGLAAPEITPTADGAANPWGTPQAGPAEGASSQEEGYARFFDLGRALFDRARRAPGSDETAPVVPEALPSEQEMIDRIKLSEAPVSEREKTVIELLIRAGAVFNPSRAMVDKPDFTRYGEIQIQEAGEEGKHNIFVVLKGKTDTLKIHGAHQDRVSEGYGTIDNWTGTTAIINAYQDVNERVKKEGLELQSTHVFALFAREEEGLIGSRFFIKSATPAERKRMDAMQNADTLALSLVAVMKNISSDSMTALVARVAKRIGVALQVFNIYGGDSDSTPFIRAGIPAYTLIGGTEEEAFAVIHSEKDTFAAFMLKPYIEAVRLAVEVVLELDRTVMRKPAV